LLLLALLALATAPGCVAYMDGPGPPHAGMEVDVEFFFGHLSPYGDWLWVEPYGWVWTPWDVGPGWHPYTHGRWAHTVHGWTWISDWPWGWAPFHYGRWGFHPRWGWFWVPGRVWAPAWVAWRHGGGWIGWAPLPPEARWEWGIGLAWGGRHDSFWWVFVEERRFAEPRLDRHVVPRPRNVTLLDLTRDVTRYEERDRRVVERSIEVEAVERARGAAVPRVEIQEIDRPPAAGEPADERSVRVYRPEVRPKPTAAVETRPPERPRVEATPPAEVKEKEREALATWEAEQRRVLEKIHVSERQEPPQDVSKRQIEVRQKAEKKQLQVEVEREKKVVENRDRRATSTRPQVTPKATPKAKPKPPPG
jgi:hypothetical protein